MGREDDELITLVEWINWQANKDPRFSLIYHVANERKTSWAAGKRLKAKGVRRGVPDICVPIPSGDYHGLYIEMKIKPNSLTPEQVLFCTGLREQRYAVYIAWSAAEAIDIIRGYLCYSD